MGDSRNTLRVVVHRGTKLKAMDRSFWSAPSSDPFVILRLDGEQRRTSVKKKTTEPKWDETFTFPAEDLESKLDVEMYDYDKLSAADFMGSVRIDLKDGKQWYDLGEGQIELSLAWIFEFFFFFFFLYLFFFIWIAL